MARMTSVQPPAKRLKMGPRLPGFDKPGQTASGPEIGDPNCGRSTTSDISSKKERIRDLTYSCKTKQDFLRTVLVKVPNGPLRIELESVSKVLVETTCPIAVIGESGSGKSTLLSAMSGYARLLPTGNKGDAVTAAPIKVCPTGDQRWNFIGMVKYLDKSDWQEVLKTALLIMADGDESVASKSGPVAQVKAVYDVEKADQLPSRSVKELLAHEDVSKYLGQITMIREDDLDTFRKQLKSSVAASTKPGIKASWPLVADATVFLKQPDSKCFGMGQELIDLPGTGDENAARASRYRGALRTSRVLLICTDTGRANSKEEYHGLIKRAIQKFQYDDRLDRIVLVCTKSDQADVTEIREDMDEIELDKLFNNKEVAKAELEHAQNDLKLAQSGLEKKTRTLGEVKKALSLWKGRATSLKKKKTAKRPKESAADFYLNPDRISTPLDISSATYAVGALTKAMDVLAENCKSLRLSINKLGTVLEQRSADSRELDLEYNRATIGARIDYIKERQANIFLSLVKESQMDRQDADQAARKSQDLIDDDTYYENVKRNLKVFCTSTIAYQDLSGLAPLEDGQRLLLELEDTEVPALMAHLESIAVDLRLEHLEALNKRLETAFTSLKTWAMCDPGAFLKQLKAAEENISEFRTNLSNFLEEVEGVLKVTRRSIRTSHRQQLSELHARMTKEAIARVTTHLEVNKKKLYPQELKAVCRHEGVWEGKRALDINLNRLAAEKVRLCVDRGIKALFTGDRCLANGVKPVKVTLGRCDLDICDVLQQLHSKFEVLAVLLKVDASTMERLKEQLRRRKYDIHHIVHTSKQKMEDILIDVFDAMEGDVRSKYLNAYGQGSTMSGDGVKAEITRELTRALTWDEVISCTLRKLEERLMEKAAAEIESLSTQMRGIAMSMKADCENAIHQWNIELDEQAMEKHRTAAESIREDLVQYENPEADPQDRDSNTEGDKRVEQPVESEVGEHETTDRGIEEVVKREDEEDFTGYFSTQVLNGGVLDDSWRELELF